VDAFDLLTGEMAGTIADGESSFAGSVDQMGCSAQISGQLRVYLYCFERSRRSAVAVLADQEIDCGVFTKFVDTRGKDDEFSVVC
jgi:hypothetical protein